jgi:hypothetical protein
MAGLMEHLEEGRFQIGDARLDSEWRQRPVVESRLNDVGYLSKTSDSDRVEMPGPQFRFGSSAEGDPTCSRLNSKEQDDPPRM